ncbi:MAG: acyl-CoA acyltransferase [Sulfurimonas sp.]|uniref:acyl-CoA acyltransferase n=1 Tax=Sulfurimonas sp. TaxID=2022749 RepID=UPI0025F60930|nr:acyl-CoA acyltransferase [Sulfurimonas sp.]MCK9454645.1 acyl-CoA acyltransferase [Sulfurimonas sp.]
MGINIRKATSDDAPFLAQMILQSTRADKKIGIYDLIFKTSKTSEVLGYLEKLINTKAKSNSHYSNFLIAEIDGKSVGSLCSYEPRIATREVFLEALSEIGIDAEESEYLGLMDICGFPLNTRTLIFDYMEELEGFMDVGILKALMHKSLLTARLKGYRIAQTIVEIGSLETLLYYKKLGFKEVKQKECEPYKEIFGRPGLVLLSIEF